MTAKTYTVHDLASFSVVIDARSPAEHALDGIPGSINCPVLNDEERRIVGTTYVQVSPFEARKIGGAMVARNIARHLDERFTGFDAKWRPLVYCWRGGMRSGSLVNVLRLVGWDAQQLKGGYKAWRHHVVEQTPMLIDTMEWRVLCGSTGSAKTRALQRLNEIGQQVVDLEALAVHRGSVLGDVPGQPQPSQKAFETQLFDVLSRLDPSKPVWVEAESRRIGRLTVPESMTAAIHRSPRVEIVAPVHTRVEFLLRDYAWLVESPDALVARLAALKGLVPNAELAEWQAWATSGQLPLLLSALLTRHYDPLYARSLGRSWTQLGTLRQVQTDDLSPAGVHALAERLVLAA